MPWTFSHPAIVFPLKQSKVGQWLNLPALIIGSLSPDLLYSFGLYGMATKAHHIIGWFYTALPLCLVICLVIHWLSASLNKILPIPVNRFDEYKSRSLVIFTFSLFIGALTHIIWDSFTHETGTVVRAISLLQFNIFQNMTDRQEIAIYKVLQHLGSLLGLLYVCSKYIQYQRKQCQFTQKENKVKLYRLFWLGIISAILASPFAFYLAQNNNNNINFNQLVFLELTITVPLFFGAIILIALWLHYDQSNK